MHVRQSRGPPALTVQEHSSRHVLAGRWCRVRGKRPGGPTPHRRQQGALPHPRADDITSTPDAARPPVSCLVEKNQPLTSAGRALVGVHFRTCFYAAVMTAVTAARGVVSFLLMWGEGHLLAYAVTQLLGCIIIITLL
jgi:hypothetical protein